MPSLLLTTLTLTLGYAILQKGGVYPETWTLALLALAVQSLLAAFLLTRQAPPLPKPVPPLLIALTLAAAIQIVPLPASWIAVLSPVRAGLPDNARTLSATPLLSEEWLATLLACVATFFLVRELAWQFRERPWVITWPLLLIATLLGLLGLAQFYGAGPEAMATGTYANRNHYAGLLELCLPFALWRGFTELGESPDKYHSPARPALVACFFLACAAVMLLGIVHSLSRMGFLATLASLFVMGALAAGAGPGKARWRRWLPVVLVGAAVVAAFIFLPPDQLIVRFADLASTNDISGDTRAQLWRETLPLIGDYRWFGCGLGSYESCFYRYKTVAPDSTADFAHNDYLQLWSELGLAGFLPLMGLAGFAWWTSLRRALWLPSDEGGHIGLACVGALTAFLMHSFVDFNLYIPANAVLAAWIGGIALRPRVQS